MHSRHTHTCVHTHTKQTGTHRPCWKPHAGPRKCIVSAYRVSVYRGHLEHCLPFKDKLTLHCTHVPWPSLFPSVSAAGRGIEFWGPSLPQ